ncbi:MAG: fructose-6-phosphate aldolase [Chloroflexi bacterium]|nr:fructose-6-phosphate aldolase [Chloroflexota bacterium]MBV9894957.1 fructose-6-phosphate aldolase [Chloroflexota bacterium]
MKLFVDSANLHDIEEALKRGFASGITTNPSILSKEQRRDFRVHIGEIISLLRQYEAIIPLSVELFTTDADEMIRQADDFVQTFGDYEQLAIKVPIGWNELRVIRHLRSRDIKVNCTCCMSYNQAMMAANAGANYVSLFWGRIRDIGYDAAAIVRQVHQTFTERHCRSEIIVGSIRQMIDVPEAIQAGADIVTVPPKFFEQMCSHPKTDEAVAQFIRDFSDWNSASQATEAILAQASLS